MSEFDVSELYELQRELQGAADRAMRETGRIGRRGATNIKRDWSMDAAFSRHFRLGPTINFDETESFGVYEAEIGPNRRFRAARLAGIAHFGGANGGGGTLGDPTKYLDAEAPGFEKALADAAEKAVFGK